jgi:hypothetical protein
MNLNMSDQNKATFMLAAFAGAIQVIPLENGKYRTQTVYPVSYPVAGASDIARTSSVYSGEHDTEEGALADHFNKMLNVMGLFPNIDENGQARKPAPGLVTVKFPKGDDKVRIYLSEMLGDVTHHIVR